MPRLNFGTLLENLVVLEVTRLCFDHSPQEDAIAFASSFAMPPLTQCWSKSENEQSNSPVFNHTFLLDLAKGHNAEQTLQELWSLCIINQSDLPICDFRAAQQGDICHSTGGPNGALLAAILAAQRGRTLHVWVNDSGGRYGLTPPNVPNSQSELPTTLARGGALAGVPVKGTTTEDFGLFPATIASLHAWLTQRNLHVNTHVGFLDPDNYAEGLTRVDPVDHQHWLRVLATDCERVLSVMFFACRYSGPGNVTRNQRITLFHNDEIGLYPQSLVFVYGSFQTGVKIRWPANQISGLVADLSQRVQDAWHDWSPRLGQLTVYVNGQPG
ncbi:MAG: hypothetical protein ACLQPD_11920 [Desulfomonilaceae bacterium]